ncbi:hypothetical protein [Enterococcus faecalis]
MIVDLKLCNRTDFTYLDFIGDEGKVANGFSEKIIQFQENRSKLN